MRIKKVILTLSLVFGLAIALVGCASDDRPANFLSPTEQVFTRNPKLNRGLSDRLAGLNANDTMIDDDTEVAVIIELKGGSIFDAYQNQSFGKTFADFALSPDGKTVANKLTKFQNEFRSAIQANEINIVYKHVYTALSNGFGAIVRYGDLEQLLALNVVEGVYVSETYVSPDLSIEDVVALLDNNGLLTNDSNYNGEGTVIAVIDSGLDWEHSAFQTAPAVQSITKEYLTQLEPLLFANYVSQQVVFTADDYYKNGKVPFGFDYADFDADVIPSVNANDVFGGYHGTHVAGIAAGDDATIKGAASKAQIAAMKVFSDFDNGAGTYDIIAALEDCALLGVDVINMSLGSPGGFSYEKWSDASFINETYDMLDKLGINICTSAGNQGETGDGTETGAHKASNPDNGLVGSPGSYKGTVATASIEPEFKTYFKLDELLVTYSEAVYQFPDLSSEPYNFVDLLLGDELAATFEYVVVPGFGEAADYEGIDVSGKIALVSRGVTGFEAKQLEAYNAGAVACILYNNATGLSSPVINNLVIPTMMLTIEDGTILKDHGGGTLAFSRKYVYVEMSDFSSMGPLPDLTFGVEMAAPGGLIYSAIPTNMGMDPSYGYLGGTSMAAPNLASTYAVVRQYVKANFLGLNNAEIQALVNRLIMSTAYALEDFDGNPYSPRKQGAGLVNVDAALNTKAYLSVTGSDRLALELGDDPARAGIYTLSFNLVNQSNDTLSYQINPVAMTETVNGGYIAQKAHVFENAEFNYRVTGAELVDDIVTVQAGKTARVVVTVKLTADDKTYMDQLFDNGIYVEGFVELVALDGSYDLSLPWLAFYGDWTDAPIFDGNYYDYEFELYPTAVIGLNTRLGAPYVAGDPLSLWGFTAGYPYPLTPLDVISFGNNPTENSVLYSVFLSTFRGLAELTYELRDKATGEIFYEAYAIDVRKTYLSDSGGMVVTQHALNINLNQFALENNQELELVITGTLDFYREKKEELIFPITMDFEAPEITGYELATDGNGGRYIRFDISDNHYVSNIYIIDIATFGEISVPAYDYTRGVGDTTGWYDITDLTVATGENNFYVVIEDCAFNASGYTIDFSYGS